MDRCELHCHDEWSNPKLRDSIVKLEDLVKRAIEYGSKGVAVTNHEIIGGHIRALELQDKIQKTNPDFKIMLGNEIYLIDETEYKNTNQYYHFILIAKNKKGHEQLRELSTRAWARSYMERGMLRTPTFYQDFEEVIGNNKGNLISSSACLGGKLAKTIIAKDSVGFNEFIQWMINTFGKENCFLEMQDSDSIEQQQVNQTIVKASGHFDIDYIITSDIHYLDKKDISIHHAFLNSKEEDDRETETFYKYTYLKPTSEIMQILSYLPQTVIERGIKNTMKIYDKIEKYDIRHSVIIPSRKPAEFQIQHILKDWYDKYQAIKDFAYSEEEQDRYLMYLIEQGIIEKQYKVTEEIAERINTELDVVWYISSQLNQRLSAYLTLVKNIIDIIWEVSFVGVSRGCFLEDSKVQMCDGTFKRIKDLKIGDKVYTHTGEQQLVYATPQYEVDEKMYSISVCGREPFTCTDNHKIFGVKQGKCEAPGSKTIYCSGKCKRYTNCVYKTGEDIVPHWIEAQDLKKGDYIATPKFKIKEQTIPDIDLVNIVPDATPTGLAEIFYKNTDNKYSGNNKHNVYKRYIQWTPNFARLVGYFIGNGWTVNCSPKSYKMGISFHSEHKQKIEDCINLIETELGITPSLIKHKYKQSVQIMVHSKPIAVLFSILCGVGSENKHIPSVCFSNTVILREIMKGLILTDGCCDLKGRRFKYSTCSEQLQYQVFTVLNLLGYNGGIGTYSKKPKHWKPERAVTLSGAQFIKFCKDFDLGEITSTIAYSCQDFVEDENYYYNRIKNINIVPYKGKVYDLSVDKDTSYVINGCAVHNSAACFLINYLIDIVQMNPLEYNIPYWRFSSKDRVDLFDIDIDVNPEKVPQIISLLRQHYGDDNVLNCLTLKTESLKSAILTACRGLGVPVEEAQVISSMVPVERGRVLSFKECVYGDEEKGISPVQGFEKALRNYENLYEVVEKIEGLISGRGIHASALYIFNNGYLVQNSLCKAPNGTPITAFNMSDSDSMGALKFDLLSTELQTKLMKTFELLLADGVIEWQGSLRETYNKYLHPKVLEYNDSEMWRKAADGEIVNIFQFEGVTGQACIRKTRPTSVAQMGAANAVMRLMSENGGQTPIDRYVAFKNNIKLWYKEMAEAGVLPEEYPILEKHLLHKFGCSIEQEDFMMIVADPKISNFTLKESNGLRKAIAKKKLAMLEEYKQKFFEKGTQAGTRQAFLDYVWTYCIQALAGYSFSVPHDIAYSLEALQQMNLCTRYNPLYWQCACLSVNAGSLETDFEILGDEEEEAPSVTEESDDEEEVKARVVTTNYGKVAKAIGEIQSQGVKILLPDINKSRVDFIPVITENAIMYGMQAINSVNIDMINNIIDKRPYISIEDFMMKNTLTNIQMINLIKAGSFDIIEKKTRPYIMNKYLLINAMTKIAKKTNLTMSNYNKMAEYKVIPNQFEQTNKLICFKKWIDKNCLVKGADNRKRYMLTEADVIKFFSIIIMDSMTLGKDYDTIPNGFGVKVSAFEKFYNTSLQPLKDWMASEEAVETFYQAELSTQIAEWSHKYCKGSIGKWEMDSIGCYVSLHELAKVNNTRYGIKDFRSLPEIAKPTSFKTNKKTGVEYPVYALCRIAGTVLNADKAKHIVSLLTVFGVVDVKFYKMAFIQYNKRISKMMPNGKKAVIENSWFTRGNKLIISGFRRENLFVPRTDYEAGFKTTVQLIEDVSNGELTLKTQREKE